MKKIFAIVLASVLLIGCDTDTSVEAGNNTELKITEDVGNGYSGWGSAIQTYIITDTETDIEYIVVRYSGESKGGITITPRLRSNP